MGEDFTSSMPHQREDAVKIRDLAGANGKKELRRVG